MNPTRPRKPSLLLPLGLLALGLLPGTTSCRPPTPEETAALIRIADQACVVLHQDLPDTEIAKICGVADAVVKAVAGPARAESARHAAAATARAACAGDGGTR